MVLQISRLRWKPGFARILKLADLRIRVPDLTDLLIEGQGVFDRHLRGSAGVKTENRRVGVLHERTCKYGSMRCIILGMDGEVSLQSDIGTVPVYLPISLSVAQEAPGTRLNCLGASAPYVLRAALQRRGKLEGQAEGRRAEGQDVSVEVSRCDEGTNGGREDARTVQGRLSCGTTWATLLTVDLPFVAAACESMVVAHRGTGGCRALELLSSTLEEGQVHPLLPPGFGLAYRFGNSRPYPQLCPPPLHFEMGFRQYLGLLAHFGYPPVAPRTDLNLLA